MIQNLFKKSAAFKISIPRNGFNISRSLSPVIIQDALAETANSRNLLSLGSRLAVTNIPSSIKAPLAWNSLITDIRLSSGKYFSNFDRINVFANSSNVAEEYKRTPLSTALSYAFLLFDLLRRCALMSALVSNTNVLIISVQQVVKDIFRKPVFLRLIANCIKKFFVGFVGSIVNYFFQCDGHSFTKPAPGFGAEFLKFFCGRVIYFYNYLFHNCISNLQKLNHA